MPLPRKQWFAYKQKLIAEGKYKGPDKKSVVKHKPSSSKSRGQPPKKRQNTIDDYALKFKEVTADDTEYQELNELFDNYQPEEDAEVFEVPQQGKQSLMSNNVRENCDIPIESDSDSCDLDIGETSGACKIDSEVYVEGQGLNCGEEMPNSPVPIFYERGDTPRETWEIERAFRDIETSNRTRERMRIAAIPETAGTVRDNTLILRRLKNPEFWFNVKFDKAYNCEMQDYENYFQNYNSLAVVIRCLPDCNVTTKDIYDLLVFNLDDPFAIICEKSDDNVMHWHMIWFTSRRSDNGKRCLQKILLKLPSDVSIAVQSTKSAKHFCRYLLKNPITLGVGNCNALEKYMYALMRENPITKSKSNDFPNQMVKDIIGVMRKHNRFTYQELVSCSPEIMQKYLHKPNIESIINNCKVFLLKPTDTDITYTRILDSNVDELYDIFPLWVFLEYQDVNPGDFFLDFWNVMFKLSSKVNVLCLQGPSNSGKTTLIRPLAELLNYGEIVAGGQFMFQNCINKELLLWEEPLIGQDFAEMCKRVFEGMTTQVNIKFKAPQTLYRTPILITTNKDVWHYTDTDEQAFRNRMFLYMFNKPGVMSVIKSSFVRRSYNNYCEWLTNLSKYISSCIANSSTGVKPSAEDGDSENSGSDREFCFNCSSDDCICDSINTSGVRAGEPVLEGVNNKRRGSSSGGENVKCAKSARLAVDDSSTTNNSSSGTGIATGDTNRVGSVSTERTTLYSITTEHKRSNGLGVGIRCIGGDTEHLEELRKNIDKLLHFCRGYGSLKKIFREGELCIQPELDRSLFEPSNKYQWLTVLRLGFQLAKGCKFF